MSIKPTEEKGKPFRLVKYFTFTSLIVIFIGSLVLSFLNIHLARSMQIQKSENFALLLAENLNHQIFLQFIIPVVLKYGKIQLRNKEQFDHMDKVVRSTLHTFKVDMVNIYDTDNIISYSFDNDMVGKKNAGGTGYFNAVSGNPTSKLIQSGSSWEIYLGFPRESRLITFVPLRAEKPLSILSGPVLGVVEIVQDLSDDYKAIYRFQQRVLITCVAVMSVLFIVLILVVKHGEGIIHKRTLERIRLKEQLNRAQRLSALGEMVAGISHEIRNPLGIIKSSAELLNKKMQKFDPSNTIPDIIVEEANRLNNIITDFLDFAKPKTPHLSPMDISEVLDKNIHFLSSQIQKDNYTITKHFNDHLPEIYADASMMYQAFLNILINAMQAMPDGGNIDITVSSNQNHIDIYFDDDGYGISEDIHEKIWDPFFTTKETGTGLGLGIVKNIIESHGGQIQISQKEDRGTRVTIQLPASQDTNDGNNTNYR